MEVRVNVAEGYFKSLQDKLGGAKVSEVIKAALTLLNWAVEEISKGRVILSSDRNGDQVHRLAMPILDGVKPKESVNKEEAEAVGSVR